MSCSQHRLNTYTKNSQRHHFRLAFFFFISFFSVHLLVSQFNPTFTPVTHLSLYHSPHIPLIITLWAFKISRISNNVWMMVLVTSSFLPCQFKFGFLLFSQDVIQCLPLWYPKYNFSGDYPTVLK